MRPFSWRRSASVNMALTRRTASPPGHKVLSDCAIVYTMQIGGPAAAKLVAQKIHPMKTNSEVSLKETVERFQEVLRGNPPPWLRKAMNKGQAPSFMED